MNTVQIRATVLIEIESKLPVEEMIDEFSSEAFYTFEDTENVTVLSTNWRDVHNTEVL